MLEECVLLHDPVHLPKGLPVPLDDGSTDHLVGLPFPSVVLPNTHGKSTDLAGLPGQSIVFGFPRAGRPGIAPLVPDWDAIPGARGCTPQICGFRDFAADFMRSGISLYGLSTQPSTYQAEIAARLAIPFPLLSDATLSLVRSLGLPTFEVAGQTLLKRLCLFIDRGRIVDIIYPVFPPDRCAELALGRAGDRGWTLKTAAIDQPSATAG